MSRAGLAFVGRCKQSPNAPPPRPIPFQFSITQAYVLEFGDNYIRFVYQGGYVVEAPVAIHGASQTDPCVINVVGTPFSNGDWVVASGVGGMTQLNGNTYIVSSVAAGVLSLQDLDGNPIDATGFGAYTSGGSLSRIYTLTSPYLAIDLPYLKFAQSADVMTLTCSNPITSNEYPPYSLTRLAAADWVLTQISFAAKILPPANVSASANTQAPSNGVNATFAYQVTAIDRDGNESIASATATCHGADLQVEGGTNTISWSFSTGAKYYNIYRSPPAVDMANVGPSPVPGGSIFGFVGSSYGAQFIDTASTTDVTQTPPTHQNPFAPGQIIAVDITNGGSGLTSVGYAITTTTGSGFAGYTVLGGGALGALIVTDHGQRYQAGDSIAFNGAGFASGAIEFGSTNPSALDTITLNGVVWTFVSTVTGPAQTLVAGTLAATLNQLVADLSASSNPSLAVAAYVADVTGANLLITYRVAGTVGNAYSLAASRATPSGATLTGGSGAGFLGVAATGLLAFTANPTNGQTIILDGVTWTFVTSGATGNQTNIGGNLAATLTQLQLDLTASSNANIRLASYAVTATQLNITYGVVGTVGNIYSLAGGTSGATRSAATLTGGANPSTTPAGTLVVGPESGTYPGVNAYFQQRRFFANSLNDPDTLWASRTGLFDNFDTSIPSVATDAITASPWTEQVNGVQWLIPMPGGLIAMTGQRAWQVIGQGSYALNVQPITPSTTQAQPQAFNGCSPTIQPIVIDYDVIYVEAVGNTTVRDLSYNFFTSIYTGVDLTLLSSHLFLYQQIVYSCWSRKPYKVMWCCRDDGAMLSLTYLKEQEVYGWARHDTLGLVVGLTSVTEPPVDAVYAIVKRFPATQGAPGHYLMERMDDRIWQSVEDTYAVDSGVSNPMVTPNASLSASTLSGATVFTASSAVFTPASVGQVIRMGGGIAVVTAYVDAENVDANWVLSPSLGTVSFPYAAAGDWSIAAQVTTLNAPHLIGQTLIGLADGVPISGMVVGSTGTVTLPFPASNVKVGLPFLPQVQTPYLNGNGVTQGARKVIPAVTVRLAASGQFQYGTNQPDGAAQNPPQLGPPWNNMATGDPTQPTGGQDPAQTYLSPAGRSVVQLWTGDLRVVGNGAAWNSKGQVAIQQTLPLPLEVISIEPEGLPGDLPENTYQPRQEPRQEPRPPGPWMIGKGARI